VSTPARWLVFITNPEVLKEVKDSEENLSFMAAAEEVYVPEDLLHHHIDLPQRVSMKYTMSKDLCLHPYHVEIISKNLTRRLTAILPEIVDEITIAFEKNTSIGPGSFRVLLMQKLLSSRRLDRCKQLEIDVEVYIEVYHETRHGIHVLNIVHVLGPRTGFSVCGQLVKLKLVPA
jgi:hypothetical protein